MSVNENHSNHRHCYGSYNSPVDLNKADVNEVSATEQRIEQRDTKFCKHCGEKIPIDAVICTHCGRQVEELKQSGASSMPNVVINNTNDNINTNTNIVNGINMIARNKWVTLVLCLLLGQWGIHKFYEHKVGTGILYMFLGLITAMLTSWLGFFASIPMGIVLILDIIYILLHPNPYYVNA